jgi:hypothetical protein
MAQLFDYNWSTLVYILRHGIDPEGGCRAD